jgi:hypothetical protein
MVKLDRLLERAAAGLKQDDYASAYRQLRTAYPLALRQLAGALGPEDLAEARRVLLRCQDGFVLCHEARGELGPAAYAARAAVELAMVLEEPEQDLAWRATYLDTLIERVREAYS